MEAPEKIYIHPDIGGREFLRPWLHRPASNESVEYVRTDVFIKRACEFLDGCIPDYIDLEHANVDTFMNVDNKRFIEDFKKYVKGE